MGMRRMIKNSRAVALQRIMAAKQVANKLRQISFVVSPSNHERPFDKLRTNGIVIFFKERFWWYVIWSLRSLVLISASR